MKSHVKDYVVSMTIATFFLSSLATAETIRVGVNTGDFKPYRLTEAGKLAGGDIEILRTAAKRAGVEIEIVREPWKRVLKDVEDGVLDAALPSYRTEAANKFAVFTNVPVHFTWYSLFALKESGLVCRELSDLAGLTVASRRANVQEIVQDLRNHKVNVIEVNDRNQAFAMLDKARVDMVVDAETAAYAFLEGGGLKKDVTKLKQLTNPRGSFLFFSRKAGISKETIAAFNEALEGMEEDGTLAAIAKENNYVYFPQQ